MLAFYQTAVFIGPVIATIVSYLLLERLRVTILFVLLGLLGLLIAPIGWRYIIIHDKIYKKEASNSGTESIIDQPIGPLTFFLFAFGFATAASQVGTNWGITLFSHSSVFDKIPLITTLLPIYVVGMTLTPIGGFLFDRSRRRMGFNNQPIIKCLLIPLFLLSVILVYTDSAKMVTVLFVSSFIGKSLFDGMVYARAYELSPISRQSTTVGWLTAAGFGGASIASLAVGLMGLGKSPIFTIAFMLALYAAAACLCYFGDVAQRRYQSGPRLVQLELT